MCYKINVVGVSFKNSDGNSRQEIIRKYVVNGMEVDLVREPENKYDKNAIAVSVLGNKAGYIPGFLAAKMATKMDEGTKMTAVVTWKGMGEKSGKWSFNIEVTEVQQEWDVLGEDESLDDMYGDDDDMPF